MADVITRLRVESSEYDAKLKRATAGIQDLEESCRKAGTSLNSVSNDNLKFVQSLGNMEAVAKSTRGKINEMTQSFTELSMIYNRLSDDEKKGTFGVALSQSLDTLKGRINDSKAELDKVTQSLSSTGAESDNTGGIIDKLTGTIGLNIKQVSALGLALGAAEAATKVAKDAFFSNEQQLDEWGRVVESSKSVYNGFLDAINTGDISGFLSRIDSIVAAARDAYNALDELATYNAFNQINVERTRTNLTESMADLRGGGGTKEDVKQAGEEYKKELRERQRLEQNAYEEEIKRYAAIRGVRAKDLRDAMSGSYGHYQDLKNVMPTGQRVKFYSSYSGGMFGGVGSYTQTYAKNDSERLGDALRRFTDKELKNLQALGAQAERTGNEIAQVDRQINRALGSGARGGGGGSRGGRVGGGGRGGGAGIPKTEEQLNSEKINSLTQEYINATDERKTAIQGEIKVLKERNDEIKRLKDEANGNIEVIPDGSLKQLKQELQELQKERELLTDPIAIGVQDDAIDEVQRKIDALNGKEVTVKVNMEEGSGDAVSSMMSGVRSDVAAERGAADQATMANLMKVTVQNGIDNMDINWSHFHEMMMEGMDIPDEQWQEVVDSINEKLESMKLEPIKIDFSTGTVSKQAKEMKKGWMDAASAIQQVGQAMQGIEDPAAKVVGIIGEAIASIVLGYGQATAQAAQMGGPWGWIAFVASGLATTLATITAVKNATKGFAEGGIVPGNSYSGDNLNTANYGINSGELILSRAQQNSIASQLQGSGLAGMSMTAEIDGESLLLIMGNAQRRRGRSESVLVNFE